MEGLVQGIRRREWIFSCLPFLSSSITFQMDKNTRYLTSDITNTQQTDHGKYHPEWTKAWTYRHHKGDALSHQCQTAAKRHLIESVPSKELHPAKIACKSSEVGSSEEALGSSVGIPMGVWGLTHTHTHSGYHTHGRGCGYIGGLVGTFPMGIPSIPMGIYVNYYRHWSNSGISCHSQPK